MSTIQDEKEAPSAELDDEIVIDDSDTTEESEQSEPETVVEETVENEAEVDTAESEEVENEDVKEEIAEKEPEPKVPYKRVKKLSDKVKELSIKLQEYESKAQAPKVPDDRPKRPSEKDFDYDQEKYQAALDKYEDELLEHKLNQRIQAEEQKKAKAKAEELRSKFAQSAEELFEKDEAYRNALMQADEDGEDLSIPPIVSEAMLESEVGHLIERELVINREELLPQLRGMNDRQRLVFLGRMEAQILSKQMGNQKTQTKSVAVSKAPKPQSEVKAVATKVNANDELKKIYPDFSME